jgi:hypothetical protein
MFSIVWLGIVTALLVVATAVEIVGKPWKKTIFHALWQDFRAENPSTPRQAISVSFSLRELIVKFVLPAVSVMGGLIIAITILKP